MCSLYLTLSSCQFSGFLHVLLPTEQLPLGLQGCYFDTKVEIFLTSDWPMEVQQTKCKVVKLSTKLLLLKDLQDF